MPLIKTIVQLYYKDLYKSNIQQYPSQYDEAYVFHI